MDKFVDLHTHSTASDGTFTPTELVREAKAMGLAAVALTDHDTVNGVPEAIVIGDEEGVEVVPGVELSTSYHGIEIHVVGLYIDYKSKRLQDQLKAFEENRAGRNGKIIGKLRELGFDITEEAVVACNPKAVVSRPHIARYLVDTGQADSVAHVFDQYINKGCPCYVPREKISPMEAVDIIHASGGIAILAHPCLYKMSREDLEQLIRELSEVELNGIEVLYSLNKEGDERDFRALAQKYGLLCSGGSDFHGANKPNIKLGTGTGDLAVPYEFLAKIKKLRGFYVEAIL